MQGPPTSWYRQPADDSQEQDDRSDAPPPPPPHAAGPHAAFTPYRLNGHPAPYNPPYNPPQYAPYYPEPVHQAPLDLNQYGRLAQPHQLGRQDSAPGAGDDSYRPDPVHQRHYSHPGSSSQMQYSDPSADDRRASYSHSAPPLFARQLPPPALEQPAPYHRSTYLPPEWNYGQTQQQMYSQQQRGDNLARVDSPREPSPPGHGHYSAAASVSSMDDHRPPLELQRSSGSRAVSASRRTSDGERDEGTHDERQAEQLDGNESEPPAAATPDAESDGKKSRKRRRLKGELPRDHALRKYKCEECEREPPMTSGPHQMLTSSVPHSFPKPHESTIALVTNHLHHHRPLLAPPFAASREIRTSEVRADPPPTGHPVGPSSRTQHTNVLLSSTARWRPTL